MPPAGAAWLGGDALNNSNIKDYLKCYTPQEWPEVTKLTLTYGIMALQHSFDGRILSMQELRQAVGTSNTTLVVQRNVPHLQRQILQLQSQLDSVFDKLESEVFGGCGRHALLELLHCAVLQPPAAMPAGFNASSAAKSASHALAWPPPAGCHPLAGLFTLTPSPVR